MRALRFAFIAVFLLAGLSLYGQSWQLVWADEFNSSIGPDWVFETGTGSGGWGNNELQYYRSQNATVSGGALVITARNEAFGGMNYTSARMKTQGRKSWKYGKVEARISMPSFQGVWPAFWMLGDNIGSVGWPACGEIDIMEHVNTGGAVFGTIHWADQNGNYANYGGNTTTGITSYHTYTIEWNSSAIKWFVDGVQYHEANILNSINGTNEFHNNFFVILNMAIGGNWPGFTVNNGALPAQMLVDYVRVYQAGAPPPPPGGAPIGQTISMRGSNNQYVSGENGTLPMKCNRATAQAWEQFTVVDAGSGLIALRSMNKYVSSGNGTAAMTANATTIGTQQRFTWVNNSDGTFSLRGSNNQYVSSENGAANMMCNRATIQGWEKFTKVYISGRMRADEVAEEDVSAAYIDDQGLVWEDFSVSPNPASGGNITIRVGRPSQVKLISAAGVSVLNQEVGESLTIDGLAPGLYIVNVSSGDKVGSRKLLVR